MEEVKTSTELYAKIQTVIDELDKNFFSGKGKEHIPSVVIAINNRCSSCVIAFVTPNSLYDKNNDKKLPYMGINPRYLNRDISYILATICHEICHLYEVAYIHIPRGGYHTKQWADLMADCGLEPKYLNKSRTAVIETIIEGGVFEQFIKDFKEKYGEDYFNIVEYSQSVEHSTKVALGIEDSDEDTPKADNADKPIKVYNRNKVKYTCPNCQSKVWGKAGLHIECTDCACAFEEEEHDEEGTEEN